VHMGWSLGCDEGAFHSIEPISSIDPCELDRGNRRLGSDSLSMKEHELPRSDSTSQA
jgi:hypothetical protein